MIKRLKFFAQNHREYKILASKLLFWPFEELFFDFCIFWTFPIVTVGFSAALRPIWDPRALKRHLGHFLENLKIGPFFLIKDQILHLAIFSHQIS